MKTKTQNNISKKLFIVASIMLCFAFIFSYSPENTAFSQKIFETGYVVYDEDSNFLFERISVEVGDIYIDKSFNKYEIFLLDDTKKEAKARFVEKLERPNITKRGQNAIDTSPSKKIGLYLTHNAESYLIGDGYDSIYGKGGIHDVATNLASALKQKGITTTLNETLHLPHDTLAYARSKVTAQKLLDTKPDAIFDIHRDGVSRRTYAKTTNGKEHSTVRIVVGQENPNQERNLAFATYLLSVAETTYPWLFLDIYFAKGHYNQNLYEKALLFEMGTYTIEKSLVQETVVPLADVIFTTLYSTAVTEDGDLIIGDNQGGKLDTVNEALSKGINSNFQNFVSACAVFIFFTLSTIFLYKWRKNIIKDKKKKQTN